MRYNVRTGAVLFAQWLNLDGTEATLTGTPTISIYHYDGASIITDISAENMVQLSGSVYYYNWLHTKASRTSYIAVCSGVIGGRTVKTSETFTFEDNSSYGIAIGGGGIWTIEDKDTIIKMLKEILKNITEERPLLKSRFDNIVTLLNNLQESVTRSDVSSIIVEEFSKLRAELNSIKSDMEDQDKILLGMADAKTLEKLKG